MRIKLKYDPLSKIFPLPSNGMWCDVMYEKIRICRNNEEKKSEEDLFFAVSIHSVPMSLKTFFFASAEIFFIIKHLLLPFAHKYSRE